MLALFPWIVPAVTTFALRQLAQYGASVDWPRVKTDANLRVRKLIPGDIFDSAGSALVGEVIDRIMALTTSAESLEVLVKYVTSGQWEKALEFVAVTDAPDEAELANADVPADEPETEAETDEDAA